MSDLMGQVFTVAAFIVAVEVTGDVLHDMIRLFGQLVKGGLK